MIIIFILLIAFTLGSFCLYFIKEKLEKNLLTIYTNRFRFLLATVLVFILVYVNPFVYNSTGYRTFAETAFGIQKVVFKSGYSFVGFLITDTEIYPNVITTSFSDEEKTRITFQGKPFPIRFNDATNATAEATVRWRLPDTSRDMLLVHKNYGSSLKLAQSTLSEYSRACLRYSAQLMESETHYSGGQSRMQEDFRSQLQEGQYVLETKSEYVLDSLSNQKKKLTSTFLRKDSNNVPIRIKSDIHQYGINVDYAQIGSVDYEPQVDAKLKKKIEASTRESVSKQELITAQQEALTAVEEGKKQIEKTRARELALKEEAVIQAQRAFEVEKLKAAKATETAKKIEAEGRAKAAANQALKLAGLTPQQEMDRDIQIADKVSKNLSNIKFPSLMVIGGNGGNTPLNPFDAVGLKSFLEINKDFTKNK